MDELLFKIYSVLDRWDREIVDGLYEEICRSRVDKSTIELLKKQHEEIRRMKDELLTIILGECAYEARKKD